MPEITLAQAEARLQEYHDAEGAVLAGGQSYQIAGRTFTRADLVEIRRGIDYWEQKVREKLQARAGRRVIGVTVY